MTDISYSDVISTTVATTALNSLAAGAYSDQLTEVDNTEAGGNCYPFGLFELLLGAGLTCAAGSPYVGLYIIYSPDGTNYPNPPSGTGAAPWTMKVDNIEANASAVFSRGYQPIWVPLLPFKFKPKVYHGLHGSTAWNSTGNVLTLYRWRPRSI